MKTLVNLIHRVSGLPKNHAAHLTARQSWTVAVVLIVLGGSFAAGCGQDVDAGATATTVAPVNIFVQDVSKEKRALPIRSSGRLATKAEVRLSFKIGGYIERVFVDEGRRVKKGTRLARLNLSEIDAQVLQAKSGVEKATRDLERAEGLYTDSVATLEQVQDARTALDVAAANLKIADFNRAYAEIYAPASGRILKRTAEAGELVGPGQPIYLFGADRGGWVVRVGLADQDIVKLAIGDSASLSFDAYPDEQFKGTVTELADAADPMSGTFEVEIAVNDPMNLLKSGFIARVDVYPSRGESLYFLPIEALVEGNGEEGIVYVYDENENKARKIPVQIERMLDAEIAVSGDLGGYTQIVTEGAAFINGDGPVRVMPATE
ncbi:MAG: efflux RND transporter periplasmic adaptor subunit [Bacteroidota bacterium]